MALSKQAASQRSFARNRPDFSSSDLISCSKLHKSQTNFTLIARGSLLNMAEDRAPSASPMVDFDLGFGRTLNDQPKRLYTIALVSDFFYPRMVRSPSLFAALCYLGLILSSHVSCLAFNFSRLS